MGKKPRKEVGSKKLQLPVAQGTSLSARMQMARNLHAALEATRRLAARTVFSLLPARSDSVSFPVQTMVPMQAPDVPTALPVYKTAAR